MKKQQNWKDIGRFFSVLLNLFAIIRDTFTTQGIGLEIIGWITGEGREVFAEEFLKPLGVKFITTQRVSVVDENTIRVNLDAPPMFLFEGAIVEANMGGGWVTVQKRSDGLYVDDHKVVLYRSEQQKNGKIVSGRKLRDEVTNLPVLHPNIMDALYEHSHLIPDDWKLVESGHTICVFFWAVTYGESDGSLYARYLSWDCNRWNWHYYWLGHGFNDYFPAAVCASN